MSERKPLALEELRKVPHGKIKDETLRSICDRANEIATEPPRFDCSEWKCGICEVPTHWVEWGKMGYEYCPHCGRPLTDAAREMLEKRLRG